MDWAAQKNKNLAGVELVTTKRAANLDVLYCIYTKYKTSPYKGGEEEAAPHFS